MSVAKASNRAEGFEICLLFLSWVMLLPWVRKEPQRRGGGGGGSFLDGIGGGG
jgi:hypothetical protein